MIPAVPPGRRAEPARRFPLGATFAMQSPWPVEGEIIQHDLGGIHVRTEHGQALLPWRTLNSAQAPS